jgi:hypothetical protein
LRFSSSSLDPLAWQVLFFLGMVLGMRRRAGTLRLPTGRRWSQAALGIVGVIFVLKMLVYGIRGNLGGLGRFSEAIPWLLPWAGKLKLEPLRLVHFAALAYLAWRLLPRDSRLLKTRPARMVISCGQHSLKIFCSSLVLSYLVCLIFTRAKPGILGQFLIIAGGWCVLLLIAQGLNRIKAGMKRPVAVLPLAAVAPLDVVASAASEAPALVTTTAVCEASAVVAETAANCVHEAQP